MPTRRAAEISGRTSQGMRVARLALVGLALLSTFVGEAGAREVDNAKIPPNDYGCTLCHAGTGATVDTVPSGAQGRVWTNFGTIWDGLGDTEPERTWAVMASLNVDGDACSNGCELADPDGDYTPGDPAPDTQCAAGDPNADDCSLPLNGESWSTLKSLFDGE